VSTRESVPDAHDEARAGCTPYIQKRSTLESVRVVQLATQAKVTKGRKLRLDASLQCKPTFIIQLTAAYSCDACAGALSCGAAGQGSDQGSGE
jgi:hypothetical protein